MAGPAVTLVIEAGPEQGKSFKLGTPRAVIGRRKGEILIKDAEISGQHSEITVNGDRVQIKDLQSTNGTFVNGKKLPSSELRDGDRLTIGQSKILVKIDSAANGGRAASPPPAPAPARGNNNGSSSRDRTEPPPKPVPAAPPKPAPRPTPREAEPAPAPRAARSPAPAPAPRARGGAAPAPNVEGIGALISEELDGFSEQTDSVVMDIARADEELKLPYRTNLFLEVIEGPDQGKKTQFPKGNMVIGRLNADVVLKDSDISRRHALIEAYTRDKIFIKDLASTNGTFVNGQKVTYDKLKHGDKIRVGKSVLKFVVEELK
jgi:ABC transport system ATP-binding/permease protein